MKGVKRPIVAVGLTAGMPQPDAGPVAPIEPDHSLQLAELPLAGERFASPPDPVDSHRFGLCTGARDEHQLSLKK